MIATYLLKSDNDPTKFHELLKANYAPYTVKTMFIRTCQLKAFEGDNRYDNYMASNANAFKHVYQSKYVKYSFSEARQLVAQIRHEGARKIAELMLATGMRIHEALKYDGSGSVVGKGGKSRPIFSKVRVDKELSETIVRRYCKEVGLCPHDLRKLAATELAKAGLSEADLLFTMGWSNIQTASRYLQPTKQDELAKKVQEVLQHD